MRMRTVLGGLLVAAVLLGSGCATVQAPDNDEFRMIAQEIFDKYCASIKNEDIELFNSIHAEDMIKLMPGKQPIIGLEQEAQNKLNAFKNGSFKTFDIKAVEAEVYGEFGFARGTIAYVFVPDSGQNTLEFSGKYLTVFKRYDDGAWKIYRGCFNAP